MYLNVETTLAFVRMSAALHRLRHLCSMPLALSHAQFEDLAYRGSLLIDLSSGFSHELLEGMLVMPWRAFSFSCL